MTVSILRMDRRKGNTMDHGRRGLSLTSMVIIITLTVGLSLLYPQGTIIARQATDSPPQTGDQKAGWEKEESDLARKTQNPISDLISVPIQTNINFGYGPQDNTQVIINIQPVIPFRLGPGWNLISRTIIPLIDQPIPDRKFGLGDIQLSLFASPSKPGKFIWGAGPILQFPTATGDQLGSGKWSGGPTVVGLYMTGPWVVGVLANNLWSFAGESGRESVNQFLAQPFINYNLPQGWYIGSSPIITANWKADKAGDVWTVPFGTVVGKIIRIGKLPLNVQAAGFYNVVKPTVGPDWTLRLQVQFLFPK